MQVMQATAGHQANKNSCILISYHLLCAVGLHSGTVGIYFATVCVFSHYCFLFDFFITWSVFTDGRIATKMLGRYM